jgi:hypothetical protein
LALAVVKSRGGRTASGSSISLPVPKPPTLQPRRRIQSLGGATATDALRTYLADRDVLLVLDNCEHVVDACAELAAALLTSCGGVRILATSRESLGVAGETVWRLEPLEPEDAYRLFVERARQRHAEFMPGHVSPANRVFEACLPYPHVPARARADVPVSYPRCVVGLSNR